MMSASPTGSTRKLTKNYEYQRVYKKGKLLKGGLVWVYILPTDNKQIRVGISASSSVVRKATGRNRLRRIIKEWFRQHAATRLRGGSDIVVVIKRAAATNRTGSKVLREELSGLLSRAAF